MIDSIQLALEQPFFLRSLLIAILLAFIFPLYGNIVVVRQEANIAHTFAHIGLLGVAVGLRCNWSIELSIFGSVFLTVLFLYFLGKNEAQAHVVHNEIGAQLGLVGAILLLSQMSGYKADISSYLFGDILLLGQQDVLIILGITLVCFFIYWYFSNQRYAISLQTSLAKSKNISITTNYLIYLASLGLLIGGAMKIIGVLLVSAFLILPSNIGKKLSSNKFQRNLISISVCLVTSIFALFASRHFDTPSGATIILFLIVGYIFSSLLGKKLF